MVTNSEGCPAAHPGTSISGAQSALDAIGESPARVTVSREKLTGAEQATGPKATWRERPAALLETDGDL